MKQGLLIVFDMDGVLTEYPSSWEYVHRNIGVDNRDNISLFNRGLITYEEFMEKDVSLWIRKLGKVPLSMIKSILAGIKLRSDLAESIGRLKREGHRVAIVSGGLSWLADEIDRMEKFHYVFANSIMTDGNGMILPTGIMNVNYKRKDISIMYLQELLGIDRKNTVSVGDSMDDSSMFSVSGYSIAYNPDRKELSQLASVTVNSSNLMPVVELIGKYTRSVKKQSP
ncbi:MAG: HAD-IB family phosphatase [Thermoplasmataceae archaeon]|jgi:phosphoserine phosphatase